MKKVTTCGFPGCPHKRYYGSPLCQHHYQQKRQGKELYPLAVVAPTMCSFDGCDRGVQARGLCKVHYEQHRRGEPLRPLLSQYPKQCRVSDCGEPVLVKRKSLCRKHYQAERRGTLERVLEPRRCLYCGEEFRPKRRMTAKCCCGKCNIGLIRLRREYGLTGLDVISMLHEQGGGCAICRTPLQWPTETKALHIDHCHTKGHVRGLLCHTCNVGLGQFRDRPDLLRIAAEYLETS